MTSELVHRQPLVRARRRRVVAEEATYPYSTLVEALKLRAEETPDEIAFEFEEGTLTYDALLADAETLAKGLFVRGVDRGGRCALLLDSGLEIVRLVFAIEMLGAAPVVIDPDLAAPVIIRRLRDVRAEIAVSSERLIPGLNQENNRVHSRIRVRTPEEVRSDAQSPRASDVIPSREDLAAIILSAGTDGETHGITFKQRHVIAWASATADRLGLTREDVLACHLPLFIGMGLAWFVFLPLIVGCKVIHLPFSERAPERWLRAVAERNSTFMIGNDSFLRLLASARFWETIEIDTFRAVVTYGEPPRQSTIGDFETRFGIAGVVRPAYGLAETLGAIAVADGGELMADRNGVVGCGQPLPGFSISIMSADDEERPVGEIGEIAVSGEAVFEAYFDQRALTEERLQDGWFYTGDLGYFDSDGILFVLGRDHEIVRLAERSLLPRQVEEAAADVHSIEALAAIGRPPAGSDPEGPETLIVVAEVSRLAREDRDQMRNISDSVSKAVKSALGLVPDEVLLVKPGVLPRTVDGRTAYGRLRDLVVSGRLGREGAILHGGNVFISPLKR